MNIDTVISTLLTGTANERKNAKKELERLWSVALKTDTKRENFILAFLSFFPEVSRIEKNTSIQAFVSALKYPAMLASMNTVYFFHFADFLFAAMQHSSGHVRQAAIHSAGYLQMSLHLFSYENAPEEIREKHLRWFGVLVSEVESIIAYSAKPQYSRYKYISSLPASVYKSAQMLRTEFLQSEYLEQLYEKYIIRRNNTLLPQIQLRYYTKSKLSSHPQEPFVCHVCKKSSTVVGAGFKQDISQSQPHLICEDCAIDGYYQQYEFATKEIAAAHRRRMFDVSYLFNELLIDAYMKQRDIQDIDDLSETEDMQLMQLTQEAYNTCIPKTAKKYLEEIVEQKEIEKEIMQFIPPDFLLSVAELVHNDV